MEMKMNGQMEIVSNCPLCGDRGLHVVGDKEKQTQQCISCGYATNFNFKIGSEESKDKNDDSIILFSLESIPQIYEEKGYFGVSFLKCFLRSFLVQYG